ncbi:E3 ubiquitin protein ligase DRIP2 [Jatropha curcas]|uniref:E3 ubiquitin protein ligase DRIP2 n=1 Tax=Jatropha curcas TaxID=180498 RepID=UPI0005FB3823|nr:E3 ubiquitin protein ligase DRIP2 [Jatropha curcas]
MLSQEVKVQREKLVSCITCTLCNKLFRDATTISECLHTFCRKCIYEKIAEEELDTCPVCNINLGCAPLEKLRVDHCLEDLKAKLFPSKREKAKAPAVVPLQGRIKERSLSSLVVSTPKVSEKSFLPGKRLKSIARKNPGLRESYLFDHKPVKKVDDSHDMSLSSRETLWKIAQTKRQVHNSTSEPSKKKKKNEDKKESTEPCEGKADFYKPLNCLVEAANKSKLNKCDPLETFVKMQLPGPAQKEVQALKVDVKENGYNSKANGDENNDSSYPSTSINSVKTKKLQGIQAAVSEGSIIPALAVVSASSKFDGRFNPIWFSLVASDDQEGDVPLPQISSCYLRVKDGSLPVSYIKKYLVQKLGLASEAEVEISLHGQPVISTLQLHNLVEWWLQMTPTSIIQTTVGSSAKDFVMVLSYGRKVQPP